MRNVFNDDNAKVALDGACATIASLMGIPMDLVTKTVEGLRNDTPGKAQREPDRNLSKKEVCALLNISAATVNRLLRGGELEKLQYSRQMVRIPESSVKKYLDSHRAGQL